MRKSTNCENISSHAKRSFIKLKQLINLFTLLVFHFPQRNYFPQNLHVEALTLGLTVYVFDIRRKRLFFFFKTLDPFDELPEGFRCDAADLSVAFFLSHLFSFQIAPARFRRPRAVVYFVIANLRVGLDALGFRQAADPA